MKKFNTLLLLIIPILFASSIQSIAQTRYLDQVFTDVSVQKNVQYATNISVLTGSPAPINLLMDVYTPVGDTETDRPLVLYFHTGSYLPPIINGQVTGSRSDSTVVEICKRLARMGYVAAAVTYRQGWNPVATGPAGQNTRTGTLLNAVYRSIHDARACVRYFRKDVAENNNSYGIDPEKIVMWGQGTGGYISYASAFLDRYEEIVLDKFINTETLNPYVDTTLSSNVYGTTQTPLNIPNHVGYSSDFALAVNMGGALGDKSWIEGKENEPAVIGFHFLRDPFAPFADGPVIVPTTGDFVVNVSGTRTVAEVANTKGTNDALAPVNAGNDPLTLRVKAYSQVPISYLGQNITLAVDNMYPFVTAGTDFRSGLWEWWDKATLNLVVAGTNAQLGTSYNADTIHNNGLRTNPNMSKELALTYIDTIINYYAPRACNALGLPCATISSVDVISASDVQLQMMPNPAYAEVTFQSAAEFPIQDIQLFDLSGRLVKSSLNIKDNYYRIQRGDLPNGMYIAKLRFERGVVTQKLIFN